MTIDVAGYHLPLTLLVAAAVLLLWLVILLLSAFARKKHPEGGLRGSEHRLIVGSILLAVAWGVAFDAKTLLQSARRVSLESTIPSAAQATGSCALVTEGMDSTEAATKLGKADEVRNDERTRGPGAETWIYHGSRCAVHILAGKVETIE
jgi:hypothetical protein